MSFYEILKDEGKTLLKGRKLLSTFEIARPLHTHETQWRQSLRPST